MQFRMTSSAPASEEPNVPSTASMRTHEDWWSMYCGTLFLAVAFLAVLTLMRRRLIEVTQNELFGSITLSRPAVAFDPRPESSLWDLPKTNGREHAD